MSNFISINSSNTLINIDNIAIIQVTRNGCIASFVDGTQINLSDEDLEILSNKIEVKNEKFN